MPSPLACHELHFGHVREACRTAKVAEQSAHGLRKSAETCLVDTGCTAAQVGLCTKARDQQRLAKDAFDLIGGTLGEQNLANSPKKCSKLLI
jgi:hypothetical protein